MAWTADTANRASERGATPGRRSRRMLVAGLATLAAALTAAAIAAAADPVPVAGVPGLTAPAGLARDTNGDLWAADSGGGVCRLLDPPFAPAEGLACPPKELQGPKSPGQMAFDAATGSVFVGDGASAGGAVWRLHLDQASDPAVVDSATVLVELPADRVVGMAYDAATGALHYSTKSSASIQRIANAATCAAPCVAATAGSAVAKGVPSLVHDGDGRLYLADAGGITRIATPGSGDTQAVAVPGFDAGTYSALAFDPVADGDGRIYAGTNNPAGTDWIDVLRVGDDALVSRYSTGFAAVTAIGIDTRDASDRALDVTDDSSAKQFGEDTVGAGRRFSVLFERFDRPTITEAPPSVTNLRTVTFGFTSPTDTTFWCSLDGTPAQACGTGLASQTTYPDLDDGNHVVQVQTDNAITGGRTTRWFEVDTRAPTVTLEGLVVAGASAQAGFVADDVSASFWCTIDSGTPAPCESPARYADLTVGEHAFAVVATDAAGNSSVPTGGRFTVVPPAVITPPVATPTTTTPATTTPPAVVQSVPAAAPWKPGRIVATLRGRTLRVTFNAPPGARYVRFTMRRRPVAPVRTRTARVIGGRRATITIVLTRQIAKRLQGTRLTVTIDAGATQKRLTTWAGTAPLRRVAARRPAKGSKS